MARKDKPYLPLYIQDFMTDEKLMECSASATGVYIRLMCVMHKSHPYGTILLKQKDKQNKNQLINFANKIAKHLPYDLSTILSGLEELLSEKCLTIEDDLLKQKRMYEDGKISETRSESGRNGGKATQTKNKSASDFAKANKEPKTKANTDIDIDNEIEDENEFEIRDKKEVSGERKGATQLIPQMHSIWITSFPMYTQDKEFDFPALRAISDFIFKTANEKNGYGDSNKEIKVLNTFQLIADQVSKEPFWVNKPLASISKNIQEFYNKIKNPINGTSTKQYSKSTKLDDSVLKDKLAAKRAEWEQNGR